MTNPLASHIDKYLGKYKDKFAVKFDAKAVAVFAKVSALRLKNFAADLARDFWKDGGENVVPSPATARRKTYAETMAEANTLRWHAEPGEVDEKMWGAGFILPGVETITMALVEPLKLNKDMNVLDLTAGLGSLAKIMAEKYGASVMAMEPDAEIAARGGVATVYDPDNFSSKEQYNCIVARELFYRVADREKFFKAITAGAKPKAQLSFTDFIVNPEDYENSAVAKWRASEKGAAPLGLVAMAEVWAKAGFTLNFHEDRTETYRKEIPQGLRRLAIELARGLKPDAETKQALLQSIQTWTLRLAAIEQGLKFYRFYGLKQ